jgi:hypothetical protein
MAPGFYIRDMENFELWKEELKQMKYHFKDECIFSIFDEKPAFMREFADDSFEDLTSDMASLTTKPATNKILTKPQVDDSVQMEEDEDDFEIL